MVTHDGDILGIEAKCQECGHEFIVPIYHKKYNKTSPFVIGVRHRFEYASISPCIHCPQCSGYVVVENFFFKRDSWSDYDCIFVKDHENENYSYRKTKYPSAMRECLYHENSVTLLINEWEDAKI